MYHTRGHVSRHRVWDRFLSTATVAPLISAGPTSTSLYFSTSGQIREIIDFSLIGISLLGRIGQSLFPMVSFGESAPGPTPRPSSSGSAVSHLAELVHSYISGVISSYFGASTLTILTCSLSARLYNCRAQLVGSYFGRSSRLSRFNSPDLWS